MDFWCYFGRRSAAYAMVVSTVMAILSRGGMILCIQIPGSDRSKSGETDHSRLGHGNTYSELFLCLSNANV
jgi:hypothetical protein